MLSHAPFGRDGFFPPLCPSGSAAALRRQVDQRVARLSQLADGHPPSLSDELSHGVQLCWSNGDKLPSVIDHTCKEATSERASGPEEAGLFTTFTWVIMSNNSWKDAAPNGWVTFLAVEKGPWKYPQVFLH